MNIEPSSIAGSYTVDAALTKGLMTGAIAYVASGRRGEWLLVYEGGNVGRAVVECYGFELLNLGLSPRVQKWQNRAPQGEIPIGYEVEPRRPTKWRMG